MKTMKPGRSGATCLRYSTVDRSDGIKHLSETVAET